MRLIFALIVLSLVLLSSIFVVTAEHKKQLHSLMDTTPESKGLKNITQERRGVTKEIWQTTGQERKETWIRSPASSVFVKEEDRGYHLVEELQDCDCWMQEKLYPEQNRQELRRLCATKATFFYDHYLLSADDVRLLRYLATGVQLPAEAPVLLMDGRAKNARFTLKEGAVAFEAKRVKATFYQGESP